MGIFIQVIGLKIICMVSEFMKMLMESDTKVNSNRIKRMAKELYHGKTVINTQANLKMVKM